MAFEKGITAEYVLFCTHKRVPERTAVPVGHESPGGAFKAQTGLRSKCCVFNTTRSPLLSRRGRRRVAAPCVCFVPWAALASCRPLPQQLLPEFPLLSLCDIFPRPGEVFGRRPRSSPLPETWAGRLHTLPTNHRCFILKCPGGQPRFFSLAAAASRIIFTQVSRPRAALMARS